MDTAIRSFEMRESEILHQVKKINCDINQKIAYDHDQILRIIFEEDLRDFENILSDLVNSSGQNADVFFFNKSLFLNKY